MKPKKKSSIGFFIGLIFLMAVAFVALHGAAALSDIQSIDEEFEGLDGITAFGEAFTSRLSNPHVIEWTDNSQNILILSLVGSFIVVAYIATNKRNTIAGKEHGTAKWGGISDIRDLFAANILKEEIRKALKTKFFITRYFAKRKVFKQAEINGRRFLAERLAVLNDAHDIQRERGTYNKRLYNEDKARIIKEVKTSVQEAKIEGWKPLQFKRILDIELSDAKKSFDMGYLSKSSYSKRISEATITYKKNVKAYYRGKNKVQQLKRQYKDADSIFTASEKASIFNYKINNNVLIMGGSGSGKTRGFVMPNLLQAHSSFVITDPKGEILEKGGHFLQNIKGYDIRVLNLDNKSQSDGYNPFVYIHPERDGYEERVLSLIEAIIVNTDGGETGGGSDPFWDKAERLFLQAIFFFTCDGFPLRERNMNTVLALIGMLQLAEDDDAMDSDLDYFAKIFKEMHGEEHIGYQQYNEFRSKASGKTAKSIVISAVARLAPFRTSAVKKMFSYDTMNLDQLGEKKMAIFVVVPPTDTTFNFIAGMLFTQMFQELQYCATEKYKHQGQRLPVPVRFVLDEFANTCTIPQFVKILAYARSFGIGIVPILQSLEQIKSMYEDEWGVVIDNCSTRLFLGSISNIDTLEYMSKMLGDGTYDKKTRGRSKGKQGSSSENWDVVGRALLDPAEIGKLPKEDCLLFIAGRNPFYSKKYDYTAHPNYIYTSDSNKSYSYHYTPVINPLEYEGEKAADVPVSTHGEYDTVVVIESREDDIIPSVRADIALCDDEKLMLERLTDENGIFETLSNELIFPNYGEVDYLTDKQADMILDALEAKEAVAVADSFMDDIIASVTSKIELNDNPIECGTSILDAYKDGKLEIIPDEAINPCLGEDDIFTDEQAEMIVESIEDSDYEQTLADIVDFGSDVGDMINILIDRMPSDEIVSNEDMTAIA